MQCNLVSVLAEKTRTAFQRLGICCCVSLLLLTLTQLLVSKIIAILWAVSVFIMVWFAIANVYFFLVGLLVCFTNFGWKNKMPSKSVKRALKLSTDCKCRYWHVHFCGYYYDEEGIEK